MMYKKTDPVSSDTIRYSLMYLTEACAAVCLLLGKVSRHVSADRLVLLTILFNAVAIGGRGLVALFADRVKNRHTGVLLGVMLFFLGFFWPPEFGVDPQVMLAAVGSALFHGFSASSVMAKSAFKSSGMGLLLAGAALGTGLGVYAKFFGYIAVLLFVVLACPSDRSEELPDHTENRCPEAPKTGLAPAFVPLLLGAVALSSYTVSSLDFSWNTDRKTALLLVLAMALGRAVGGFLSDRFRNLLLLPLSLGGGALVLAFLADGNRYLALGGLFLFSLSAAPILSQIHRFLPAHPGFAVALGGGAAYLGYAAVKYEPMREIFLLPFALLTLLLTLGAELCLGHFAKKRSAAEGPAERKTEEEVTEDA